LIVATLRGHARVVQVLLELGLNPNHIGSLLIHVAITEGHDQILRMLLESGADRFAVDDAQRNPLHKTTLYGRETAARQLLEHVADIDALDASTKRPLDIAVSLGSETFVRLLIDHGADVRATDAKGDSALVAASHRGHLEIVDMLLEAGDPVSSEQLDRALSEAFNQKQNGVVESLVRKGAKHLLFRPRRPSSISSSSAPERSMQSTPEMQAVGQGDLDTYHSIDLWLDQLQV
jgi:ankyrin repeat protein